MPPAWPRRGHGVQAHRVRPATMACGSTHPPRRTRPRSATFEKRPGRARRRTTGPESKKHQQVVRVAHPQVLTDPLRGLSTTGLASPVVDRHAERDYKPIGHWHAPRADPAPGARSTTGRRVRRRGLSLRRRLRAHLPLWWGLVTLPALLIGGLAEEVVGERALEVPLVARGVAWIALGVQLSRGRYRSR